MSIRSSSHEKGNLNSTRQNFHQKFESFDPLNVGFIVPKFSYNMGEVKVDSYLKYE